MKANVQKIGAGIITASRKDLPRARIHSRVIPLPFLGRAKEVGGSGHKIERAKEEKSLCVNFWLNLRHSIDRAIDRAAERHYCAVAMSKADLDRLRLAYKKAIDEWVDTIREEEELATPDHSMVAMEHWDAAHLKEHDAHTKATATREAYKDGLRGVNYGI